MNYIEVKDEILNGEALYRIRDANGNIIFDNLTIEMITQITQQATPLNKLLFDKITSRLALSSKYNNPTFKIENSTTKMEIDVPLEQYENGQKVDIYIVPVLETFSGNVIPNDFTTNSKDGFYASDYKAFTSSALTFQTNNPEIIIQCPIAIIPDSFTFYLALPSDTSSHSATVNFYGSNDGSQWEQIANQFSANNEEGTTYTAPCTTQKYFKYFKIIPNRSGVTSYNNRIANINISSGKKSTFNEYYAQTMKIGGLAEVPVEGTVELIKKTSLIYLNNKFIVKETEGIL